MLQARIGSADWNNWQIHRWQYWDYVRYPGAGTLQLSFFANPTGSTEPTSGLAKTMEITNNPKARSFGQVFFVIEKIRTHLSLLPKNRQPAAISSDADVLFTTFKNVMDEVQNISIAGVLNFLIGQKQYFQILQPFRFCPPGFGVNIIHHAALIDWSKWFQLSPNDHDTYQLSPAQLIEPEQTIDLTIDFPEGVPAALTNTVNSATPSLDVGVILDGYIARPAQ